MNWELRIIKTIIDDSELELSLLIKDGRTDKAKKSTSTPSKHIAGKTLFNLQTKLERKSFHSKRYSDRNKIIEELPNIPTISLNPIKKEDFDIFTAKDSKKVEDYNLDILLKHKFNIIQGSILKSSKYGIWSFHYGDSSSNLGKPSSLLKNILEDYSIEVILQQLTSKYENSLVIDKAYFSKLPRCKHTRH